jgi:hypothetical protein
VGFLSFLSKTFRYVNENGESITFTYNNGFLINKPVGIDTLQVSLSQATGIDQVGATIQSANVQPRPVTVSGILVGEFIANNKEKLLSVVRPDLTAKLYADDYYLNVRPTSTPTIDPTEKFAKFQFSVLAAYPYWQKDSSVRSVLSGLQYMFKFPWNISRPYQFAKMIETQFINVSNHGQLPVPMTVTFFARGDCLNPKITNVNTGKFMAISKSLVAGERVVVEITHDRTYVTSSVDGDIRGALSLKSTLNRLDVGDNVLKPEAEEGGNQLEVSIDFATEIVGITL